MSKLTSKLSRLSILSCLLLLISSSSDANVNVWEKDDKHFSIGAALRTTGTIDFTDDHNWNGPVVDNARITTKTAINDNINFVINLEKQDNEDFNLLDGYVAAKVTDKLNLRGGRFIIPTDRASLSSEFDRLVWDFASVVSKYPSVYNRRAEGVAIWADFNTSATPTAEELTSIVTNSNLKYYFGVFTGVNNKNSPLIAFRGTIDLLNNETGYTLPGTYFGEKEVWAIGGSVTSQKNAFSHGRDFFAFNVDALLEKMITSGPDGPKEGVLTIGASFNKYDLDGAPYQPGTGLNQGKGFSIEGGFLPSDFEVASGTPFAGQIQPYIRYQKFDFSGARKGEENQIDAGINYILSPNAIVNAIYSRNELNDRDSDELAFGMRFRF